MKKGLKIAAITLVSVFVIFLATIGILINFVFTPEKITPPLTKVMTETFNAEVDISAVDLTFFSSFPRIGVEINGGSIKPHFAPKPLAKFTKATLVVNIMAYLTKKEIRISRLELIEPEIYLFTDSLGRTSLDIFKTDSTQTDSTSNLKLDLAVKELKIVKGDIVLDNRQTNMYAQASGLNMVLKGMLNEKISGLKLDLDMANFFLWQDNQMLVRKVDMKLKSQLRYNADSLLLNIDTAQLAVFGLEMDASGVLRGDSAAQKIDVDLRLDLAAPSLSKILGMIPPKYVKQGTKLDCSGSVALSSQIKGAYGVGQRPHIDAKLTVSNGKAKYSNMPMSIDALDIVATCSVDLTKQQPSTIILEKFTLLTSGNNTLDLQAKLDNVLVDPLIAFRVNSKLNLDELAKVFPLQEGVVISGGNNTQMKGRFRIKDLEDKNFAEISLNGSSIFSQMVISVDGSAITTSDSSYLYIEMKEGQFLFGNSITKGQLTADTSKLTASFKFNGVGFRDKRGINVFLRDMEFLADSKKSSDTLTLSELYCSMSIGGIKAALPDTLDFNLQKSKVSLKIEPVASKSKRAKITVTLDTDSLSLKAPATNGRAGLKAAGMQMIAIQPTVKGNNWDIEGNVGFRGLSLYSKLFPLRIRMPATHIQFKDSTIRLAKAKLRVGKSNLQATGTTQNLLAIFLLGQKKILSANLHITSDSIDLGQIMWAMDTGSYSKYLTDSTEVAEIDGPAADSTLSLITIPDSINLNLNLNVGKIKMGRLSLNNITGNATMANRAATLNDLNFKAFGADMHSCIYYKGTENVGAKIWLDLKANNLNIGSIADLMPSISEIIPMLPSLKGIVDFEIVAKGAMDTLMNIDIATLNSVISLKGTDLVLMDGQTFKEVSKMLMFKNKKENVIDSLGLYILAREGRVDVPPFEIEIDRYRAIVGGEQTINPKTYNIYYNYNVSIIKSPLPFKAGVDISGDINDFKYKITKAKLKNFDFNHINHNVDSMRNVLLNSKY